MATVEGVSQTSLAQRVVLLGLVSLAEREACPAHSFEIRRECAALEHDVDDVLGGLSEADVMRALNELQAIGLVEEHALEDPSPVGKGRPNYEPAVDSKSLLDVLSDDHRVGRVVTHVRRGNK